MTATFLCLGVAGTLLIVFLLAATVRNRRWHTRPQEPRTFDPERYAALARLLREEDIEFLREQGARRGDICRYRAARSRAARLYLRSLRQDFHYFWHRAQYAVALSPDLHAQFGGDLIRRKLEFEWIMLRLRCRLAVSGFLPVGSDARRLAPALDSLRHLWELPAALVPAPSVN